MKLEMLSECPDFLRDFLTYNETIRGKSSRSVEGYYIDLRTFFRYMLLVRGKAPADTEFNEINISSADIELVRSVTISDLYAFMVYCKEELKNNTATRARKTSTLRIFFKYMSVQTHRLETNPAELLESPKVKQSLPKHLTLENSLDLLNAVDGANERRDYCIITLFLNCGLRLSELCGLNLSDISSDGIITVTGKGNKERSVYLNDSCKTAIKRYLEVRPNEGIPATERKALFISRNHRRLSPKTVQHIVKTTLEKAGLGGQGFSTHKLRHTAATLMYQHGNVDIRVLKDILGHSNLGTTQIYTHVSDKQIKHAVDANPLSGVKDNK
ncbi:MAG: tyrosine recombinase XerC [Acutalibacteraceae bacterium]|nr:tyrosine recombinase XerC [Clostridia bacterium]MEE1329697.1 tyrosine recombinase XerC [Acutalibacteraceae bacterium]